MNFMEADFFDTTRTNTLFPIDQNTGSVCGTLRFDKVRNPYNLDFDRIDGYLLSTNHRITDWGTESPYIANLTFNITFADSGVTTQDYLAEFMIGDCTPYTLK